MIRWFADLPIERKLRVVILVPAIVVFAVAMIAHIALNLLHLRDDLLWSAARVARVTGTSSKSVRCSPVATKSRTRRFQP